MSIEIMLMVKAKKIGMKSPLAGKFSNDTPPGETGLSTL